MVTGKLPFHVALLALLVATLDRAEAVQPLRPQFNARHPSFDQQWATDRGENQVVFAYNAFETGADLQQAIPVQFQAGGGGRAAAGGQTTGRPASLTSTGQRTPQSFAIRLARAPNMMGDFIGRGGVSVVAQTPSFTVTFNDFYGQVVYSPTNGSFGDSIMTVLTSNYAEFAVNGAFVNGDATGVAFRSFDTIDNINSPFDMEIAAADGSGISDSEALNRYQTAADSYLNTPGSDPQQDLEAQQQSITADHGSGTFEFADEMDSDTITFASAVAEANPQPTPSRPQNPNPAGGSSSVDEDSTESNAKGGKVTTNAVSDADPYYVSHDYTVSYADRVFIPDPIELVLPSPAAADIVGRVRIQDNNSPLPKDRVYFDYNFFHNVPMTATGIDVNRFAPGVEKTFLNKMASVDVRIPMAITLDSTVLLDGLTDSSHSEFGNLSLISKFLLTSNESFAVAAGLGVSVPTADDLHVNMADGTQLISVVNDSTHLLPYVAALYTPRGKRNSWVQAFLTCDFDTVGNEVFANVNGTGLESIGVWQDQHLLTFSLSFGSWCYENYAPGSLLKRIGWSAEVHYTSTLNDADSVSGGNFMVGDPREELDLVNGTFGGHVQIGKTIFTTGYAVPLTESDKVFDGELRFFANRYF